MMAKQLNCCHCGGSIELGVDSHPIDRIDKPMCPSCWKLWITMRIEHHKEEEAFLSGAS